MVRSFFWRVELVWTGLVHRCYFFLVDILIRLVLYCIYMRMLMKSLLSVFIFVPESIRVHGAILWVLAVQLTYLSWQLLCFALVPATRLHLSLNTLIQLIKHTEMNTNKLSERSSKTKKGNYIFNPLHTIPTNREVTLHCSLFKSPSSTGRIARSVATPQRAIACA